MRFNGYVLAEREKVNDFTQVNGNEIVDEFKDDVHFAKSLEDDTDTWERFKEVCNKVIEVTSEKDRAFKINKEGVQAYIDDLIRRFRNYANQMDEELLVTGYSKNLKKEDLRILYEIGYMSMGEDKVLISHTDEIEYFETVGNFMKDLKRYAGKEFALVQSFASWV